jgi:hypothetical protein
VLKGSEEEVYVRLPYPTAKAKKSTNLLQTRTLCTVTDTEKGEEEIAYLALEIKVDTIDGLRLKLLVSLSTN